ncbi:uncharacterized protein LOC106166673 [Lingula anatina]|uniref:Uncharacterized protein LOC106166673 n=1 Tax=Lingula anatina TaxID=7574 RepID=A0A2R2MQW0_LINAN|nr:uncharacterized protein LOC106166673 [Lingula anatina]|eukprot:XP_023932630.1 uncharacterized protein LOC106166673 [Lingula anatina]
MKRCTFIPLQLFDLEGYLRPNYKTLYPREITSLIVGVITPQRVVKTLKLPNLGALVDLAIIQGNDFTSSFMSNLGVLRSKLSIGHVSLEAIAQWLRWGGSVEKNEGLREDMRTNSSFREAVHYTKNFYNLTMPPDGACYPQTPLSVFLESQVRNGHLPSSVLAMHGKVYWHHSVLEDIQGPSIEMCMLGLRCIIYRMVLPSGQVAVLEYGRVLSPQFQEIEVTAALNINYLRADKVIHCNTDDKFKLFHHIMTHMESESKFESFFQHFGQREGFICYVLRYILLLDTVITPSLDLRCSEFDALFAAVFCLLSHQNISFTGAPICIRPSIRCITVANWFQTVYLYA